MIYDTKGCNEALVSAKGLSVSPDTNKVMISGF